MRLRPSGSHRWVKCPGSIQMQEQFPQLNETNEAAEQGTAAHWVGEQVLTSYTTGGNVLLCSDFIDIHAPNGVMITEEMAEGADVYIMNILNVCQKSGVLSKLQVEQHVKIEPIHPTESGGTPDAWVFCQETNTLHLWDLKFGFVIVEPFENWQLMQYAIGVLYKLPPISGITVNLTIVQPRPYHTDGSIRTWSIKASELLGLYLDTLRDSAQLALSPNPPTKSGSHCKYCSAFHACKTANRSAMNAIDVSNSMQVEVIPNDQLKSHRETLIRAQESITGRLNAIDAQIVASIKNNVVIEGLAIDNPPGRLAWDKPIDDIIAFGQLMNVDLSKPGVITPTQAKKLIDESVINMYSKRPPGKTKIVDSTKSKASRVFGNKKVN